MCSVCARHKENLCLDVNHRTLCIFDNFIVQRTVTDGILQLLEDNNVCLCQQTVQGSSNQWDLSVNKSVKNLVKAQLQEWYAAEVLKIYDPSVTEIRPVKFPMSQMKSLGAQWIQRMCDHLLAHPDIIRNGFKAAGIVDCFCK